MKFTHLHLHTHYSLLDGLIKPKELVQKIKADGGDAVAITDHGVMYGVIEFYQICRKEGIKPIIGVEAYVAPNGRHNKRAKADEKNYHLLLLAKNNTGYHNLIQLVSQAHLEGFYYKPRIDDELLRQYHGGLIALSACLHGEIPTLILSGQEQAARDKILYYRELFGPDNFYLELQHNPNVRGQEYVNQALLKLGKELDVGLVATNDAHYLNKEDDEPHDVLLCLQTKRKKKEVNRMNMLGEDFSVKTMRQMIDDFKDIPEAIDNTNKIADRCSVDIPLGQYQLPAFIVPAGYNEASYLEKLCREGLQKRYGVDYERLSADKRGRLDYELAVINKMGFASYFLIVADFVNWAKNNGIVVGPGRGSAAGSFVSYVLGITNLDPLQYDLLFERFLNPERISMPDIDLDFTDTRRDEVIRYVEGNYGKDHVAQIITFSTMAARAAVRDVGRVLDYPYDYCDKIAKLIPMFSSIEAALHLPELRELYRQEEGVRVIIDNARRIENVIRHASVHACGVLITKEPVTAYAPVQYVSSSDKDTIVSQYSLHPVEDLGLLKMDFLGLKNLTIIESALKIIKNTRSVLLDIDAIPLDEQRTFALLQRGETTGVFQLESSGMKRYLKELKPTVFEDIIAMVALYRPGPMEWIPDYIAGKHGLKKPKYLHSKLEPILNKTYGVAIYQEQIMETARSLAGFTMGEADVLRRAIGKKIPKLLAEQKTKFIEGCVKNGIAAELAAEIFAFIEPFAGYGFNRSHAACYALIGYQTAYLKANYPTEFMAALMTSDQEDIDRIPIEIEECRQMGIEVLPPDLNESFSDFTVVTSGTAQNIAVTGQESTTIRFGLRAVKNVGAHITAVIIQERKENGPYKDIADFLQRAQDKDLNKKSLESLIMAGAFDKIEERGKLLANVEKMLEYSRNLTAAKNRGQDSLFSVAPELDLRSTITLDDAPPAEKRDILNWERTLLGLYLSDHPFNEYEKILGASILPLSQLNKSLEGKFVNVGGVITTIKRIVTKSNDSMLFVKIEDKIANIELLVFPSLLKESAAVWQEGNAVICRGRVSNKENELKLLCERAKRLEPENALAGAAEFLALNKSNGFKNNNYNVAPLSAVAAKNLKIKINDFNDQNLLKKLKEELSASHGESKVYFYVPGQNGLQIIETGFKVKDSRDLRQKLTELVGEQAVK
ncbi:DNA polymerase III subunit alpha [Candidatus Falkowbacteria bacterium RIFCSPLOWO2_02_FULL_45_15]|uniref:DNA polymerase III subunit alpha n=2 Tax=Candidatus Falkowiibacteriota TaxID=1752728 RepID=A0A1F5RW27_9BACT|nr:MAG: DNA polymerase III subunit alpha [Candidatus Falkowbacteria bacterium RIFCSPHIGHO2_02_FULL_45_15]OGF18854.1 MAG: DNA polymerase III subunit alpha [Candidatus Falkowbacteria bacterium RIFCSPLOWO2_02_FULL_45_15]